MPSRASREVGVSLRHPKCARTRARRAPIGLRIKIDGSRDRRDARDARGEPRVPRSAPGEGLRLKDSSRALPAAWLVSSLGLTGRRLVVVREVESGFSENGAATLRFFVPGRPLDISTTRRAEWCTVKRSWVGPVLPEFSVSFVSFVSFVFICVCAFRVFQDCLRCGF